MSRWILHPPFIRCSRRRDGRTGTLRHVDTRGGRVVVDHHRDADGVGEGVKCCGARPGQAPVRDRQRITAVARAARRSGRDGPCRRSSGRTLRRRSAPGRRCAGWSRRDRDPLVSVEISTLAVLPRGAIASTPASIMRSSSSCRTSTSIRAGSRRSNGVTGYATIPLMWVTVQSNRVRRRIREAVVDRVRVRAQRPAGVVAEVRLTAPRGQRPVVRSFASAAGAA